jgi:CheY-like chemotaxis protein
MNTDHPSTPAAQPAATDGRLPRILVVDDSKVSRMVSCSQLRTQLPGVQVLEAADTEEARRQIEAHRPDWLLLDHNMPGETGLDLAAALRPAHPALRIALLTANVQGTTRDRAAALGVEFFAKPINATLIAAVIDRLSARAPEPSA